MHECSYIQLFATHGLQPAMLLCSQIITGNNTGEGCHFLLHGIFSTQDQPASLLSSALEVISFTTEPLGKFIVNRGDVFPLVSNRENSGSYSLGIFFHFLKHNSHNILLICVLVIAGHEILCIDILCLQNRNCLCGEIHVP